MIILVKEKDLGNTVVQSVRMSNFNYRCCFADLCGTPGYLAPEVLKCNMFENAEGYGYEVDV